MSAVMALELEARKQSTKGYLNQLRANGKIPGIIYGGGQDPVCISISQKVLKKELHKTGLFTRLFESKINDQTVRFMARDVQFHPVTDEPLHVDFLLVTQDSRVHVAIPLRFINEDKAPGLKKGGVLNIILHTLNTSVLVRAIPDEILIDLTGCEIGHSIHLNQIDLPEGVEALHPEQDNTIATIVSPSGLSDKEES